MDLAVDSLTTADVPDAMGLSTQAGWNQVPADWHRLLDLEPAGCFAGRVDGDLVATGTLVTYDGAVGWIGMILVDEAHRRQGYGTAIFDRVVEHADERNVAAGLDATDAGREVYRKRDFVDVTPIERWCGELSAADPPDGPSTSHVGEVSAEDGDRVDAVCEFDRQSVGVDRGELVRHLFGEDRTTVLAAGEEICGYAVVRPGREHDHLGPLVASSRAGAEALVAGAADVVTGTVLVDVLDVEFAESVLEPLGMEPQRHLTRMAADEPDPLLVGEDVRVAAGFELG
jgi:GNAT superfamily N-acetyltransferase